VNPSSNESPDGPSSIRSRAALRLRTQRHFDREPMVRQPFALIGHPLVLHTESSSRAMRLCPSPEPGYNERAQATSMT
jgi:hypothetical protein